MEAQWKTIKYDNNGNNNNNNNNKSMVATYTPSSSSKKYTIRNYNEENILLELFIICIYIL